MNWYMYTLWKISLIKLINSLITYLHFVCGGQGRGVGHKLEKGVREHLSSTVGEFQLYNTVY